MLLWISVTLMVRSPEADTIYLSSKSTTFTAARCPTRTRRRLMSVGEAMSQTAMERSLEQVTIRPFAKRRWRTASLWWISVFSTSPVVTSQTLQKRRVTGWRWRRVRTEHKMGEQGEPGKKVWAQNEIQGSRTWRGKKRKFKLHLIHNRMCLKPRTVGH